MNNTIYVIEGSYGVHDFYTSYIIGWFKSEADARERVEALKKVYDAYCVLGEEAWNKFNKSRENGVVHETAKEEHYETMRILAKNLRETLASLGDTEMMAKDEIPNGWEVIPVSELV